VVVITGASSEPGIGRATAQLFHEQGARIAILDLNQEAAVQAASAIGPGHFGLGCDVTDSNQCLEACEIVLQKFGRIDALVNSAGITQSLGLLDIKRADYDRVMDVNLRGGFHMCQAVIPAMLDRKSGAIVFISSVTGQRGGGIFGGPHYAAAKAAVLGLTKSLARAYGPMGIRSNAVAPGVIDTDITKGIRTPEQRLESVKGSPIPRLGTAREVVGACLFLVSDLSSYITGSVIDVNGGMHMH